MMAASLHDDAGPCWVRLRKQRRGVSSVEFAMFLPVFLLVFVIAFDFARIIYPWVTITNCARNGAFYQGEKLGFPLSPQYYSSYQQAAVADGVSLRNPTLSTANVSTSTGSTNGNPHVDVTVTYQFQMVTSYLGFSTKSLSRTVRMPVVPQVPTNFP
jgi:Flp pilus assembly protein TadG